ncbi:MAG TPA: NrsF family protein, partial [Candidatus Sulfotelmatobacter sp.]|nr:NrsF family protein [Candidatus Sulfotelmatobacter sp.]
MADVERLIHDLAADLAPVRRLRSPAGAAFAWLAVVLALALALGAFADLGAIGQRLAAAPDMWLAVTGSCATAVLAAFAAFQLGRPDRSPLWSLLPLPGALLWIGASGVGCLRDWLVPGTHDASLGETKDCL